MNRIEKVFELLNYKLTKKEYQEALTFFGAERDIIRNYIEKLSWNKTDEEQRNAINYLSENLLPLEYIYLVLPDKYTIEVSTAHVIYYKHGTDKTRWENAAKTIVKIGWPKVDNIIIPLFVWLLDLNWPGSVLIHDFILSLPQNVLREKMKYILKNLSCYPLYEREDMRELIADLCDELGIIL